MSGERPKAATIEAYERSLNILAKWRSVFTGRILGTRGRDPQTQGFRDLFEKLLILRVEVSALSQLLDAKGIISFDEYMKQVTVESDLLTKALAEQFPGMEAKEYGISYDLEKAQETMKGWPP
jgi:hypothetical protein